MWPRTLSSIYTLMTLYMYLGEPSTIADVDAWLSAAWTSRPLTWASDVDGIRFLGLEVYKTKVGYKMCQFGHLRELLLRAGALRELVREGILRIRHIPGVLQKAI